MWEYFLLEKTRIYKIEIRLFGKDKIHEEGYTNCACHDGTGMYLSYFITHAYPSFREDSYVKVGNAVLGRKLTNRKNNTGTKRRCNTKLEYAFQNMIQIRRGGSFF